MEKRKQRQRKSNRGENGYEGSRGKGKKGNEEKNGYEKSKGKGTGNNKEEKGYSDGGPTPYSKKEQSAGKGKRKEEQRAMATLEKRCHHKGYHRCGQPGHMAKDWRVSVYNRQEVDNNKWQQEATAHIDGQQRSTCGNNRWTDDQTQVQAVQQQQQLALPPPQQQLPRPGTYQQLHNPTHRNWHQSQQPVED